MNRLFFLLAGLVWWGWAGAQDLILLRNADELKAVVTEITDTEVLYKVWDGMDEVLRVPRADVFSITYQNGDRELFADEHPVAVGAAANYPWPAVTRSYRPGDLFDEDGIRGLVVSVTGQGRHGLILSLDQAELPWVGQENETALAGTVETIAGWTTVEYKYHGGLALGLNDRKDGWNNRSRLIACLASTGFSWSDFPAFEWCEQKGAGWYLPACDELKGLWALIGGAEGMDKITMREYVGLRNRFNACMERYGGDKYPVRWPIIWFWSSTEKSAAKVFECDLGCGPHVVWRAFKKTYSELQTSGSGKAAKLFVRAVHKF